MSEIFDTLKGVSPHAITLLIGMTAFGIYWKKSRWPSQYFGVINLVVAMMVYPLLELSISDEPYHKYRQPIVVLALAGAGVAMMTVILHKAIIGFLKKKFPAVEWPDETTFVNKDDVLPSTPAEKPPPS